MRNLNQIIERIKYLPVTLPIVFCLIFFGILPPQFDAVIYTDNIKGEGICSAFISSPNESFAYLYEGNAYFGSELKTLRLRDLRYDIDEVTLYVYDVQEADILSFDISIFGITVTHVSGSGLTHPFTRTVHEAKISDEPVLVHMKNKDTEEVSSVSLTGFDFIPVWLWVAYFSLIILASLILALGLWYIKDKIQAIENYLFGAATILAALILGAFFCGSMPYVSLIHFLLNWILFFAASLIVGAVTLPWVGSVSVSIFVTVWYIANYFVIQFRSKPIMPADLKAFSTAKEVIDGYSLIPSWQMIGSVVLILLYCACVIANYYRSPTRKKETPRKSRVMKRCARAFLAVIMIICVIQSNTFASVNSFAWDARVMESFHREGIALSFLKNEMNSMVKKPEGYSREVVDSYLAEYLDGSQGDAVDGTQPTNIIMVMNEAFADLRTVGMDESIDVMPFIDSLVENTVSGNLYVSIYGGGTCNSEFEALTGNSLAFLGIGAYPYTENITSPLFSLAWYYKGKGYVTEAFHASQGDNWNRNMVYPFLGFDVFHDIKDYSENVVIDYVHRHVSDATDYRFIEKESENNSERPRFLFGVTIQNHSNYDRFEGIEEAAVLKENGQNLNQKARVYLSLVKASDDEVKQLVETYRDSEEPTMIIFFGDHQPGLSSESQENIYTAVYNNLDYYKTKFFIWTNYDTEEQLDMQLSANFLPWLILERGNFSLPPYVQMLKEVHEKYPVISSQGVMDAEGNVYAGVAELMDDPLIKKYQCIQYANLFDEIDDRWFETE